MQFGLIEILQGSFSLAYVIISVIIGVKIILKYFEHKTTQLLLVGTTWIGLSTPWWPDSINLILVLTTNSVLSAEANFIIGTSTMPFFLLVWLKAFTNLVYTEKQKIILIIFFIIGIIFEIIFFYFLFTQPNLIGTFKTPFQVVYGLYIEVLLVIFLLVVLITGILFGKQSLRSDNPEVKLKGKFLIIAFILFTIGAFLDSIVPELFILARIVLDISALLFYFGFMLPDWLKERLL
ncbi:MAG: hypothetical protein ACFFHV_11610 [Promethearchaeota archaeon]